jgi:hypothetical protein
MRLGILLIVGILMTITPSYALAEEALNYNDHAKRDPFWPLVNSGGAIINYDQEDLVVTDLVLEGIMTGEKGENIAMINGMIVQPNDTVGLYVIKAIEPTTVVIQKGEETFVLKIKKED